MGGGQTRDSEGVLTRQMCESRGGMSPGRSGNTLLSIPTAQTGKWVHGGVGMGQQQQKTLLCISLFEEGIYLRPPFSPEMEAEWTETLSCFVYLGGGMSPFKSFSV